MNRYAVIMAGRIEVRPLSRSRSPKQLLRLMSDQTLLEETIRRLTPLIPLERVLVVCNRVQAADVAEAMPDLPAENIVGEPVGAEHRRVPGPRHPPSPAGPGQRLLRPPADHFIRDENSSISPGHCLCCIL